DGAKCDFGRHDFNVGDLPVLDAILPRGKAFPHQWAMLSLIESHDVTGSYEIARGALLREPIPGLSHETALLQGANGESGPTLLTPRSMASPRENAVHANPARPAP